jgi:hypothetical protein
MLFTSGQHAGDIAQRPWMFISSAARGIFLDMHIRFIARLMMNNISESLMLYSLSVLEWDEIWKRDEGASTR